MKGILCEYAGQKLPRRIVVMLIAVTFMGFGTSLCILANTGADPCSTMNLGLSAKLGLSFGVFQALINILILILVVIFSGRAFIGLGTIGNMFICGFSADFFRGVFSSFTDPASFQWGIRIGLTLLGALVIIAGCSLYMTSNLGMAPYDCVAFVMINRIKKRKLPYRWVRMTQDALALIIGFLCGATVGIGTVIMVFLTGPLIPLFNKHVAAKILGIKEQSVHKNS